jgi:hypothetical protein
VTPATAKPRRPRITEAEWQAQVTGLLDLLGWEWLHVPTVTVRRRQRDGSERTYAATPTQGPLGNGLTDLIIMGHGVTIYAELKREGGRLDPDQVAFRDKAIAAGNRWRLWVAPDLSAVERELRELRRLGLDLGPS